MFLSLIRPVGGWIVLGLWLFHHFRITLAGLAHIGIPRGGGPGIRRLLCSGDVVKYLLRRGDPSSVPEPVNDNGTLYGIN